MTCDFLLPLLGPLFSNYLWLIDIKGNLYDSSFSVFDFFISGFPTSSALFNNTLLMGFLKSLLRAILILIAIAYYTLAERKIMASVQRRRGPNVVGLFGILQPLADGLKLLCKEMVIPSKSNIRVFLLAPLTILILSLTTWAVIPFRPNPLFTSGSLDIIQASQLFPSPTNKENGMTSLRNINVLLADFNASILFTLALSSLNVYAIIIAGWASNSKYAFLGSLRSAAQMISYEVSIGLAILPVLLLAGASNFHDIILAQIRTVWFVAPLLPSALIFFVSILAETNRSPFDLPEAEAELVAGYNVEYSSIIFAMFFLGEYSNMLIMSAIMVVLFFGGWSPLVEIGGISPLPSEMWFALKVVIISFFFVIARATLPRYRYDQLMDIGWKIFLPFNLAFLLFCSSLLYLYQAAPISWQINIS